jgi:predicted ATPase/DNA-binding XRE family transcriptional regulator
METLYSFGEWLRRRRSALGLTRAELADCAACSVSALRKIEADERRPSRELAELLATCLCISSEEHAQFMDAARGVRSVDRLSLPVSQANPLPMPPPPLPLSPGVSFNQPPARPLWHLPVPATPLVGREVEMNTLAQLLGDPDCRLLTLVGPGGIGKTRLALEMACLQWERYNGNVFFAPLVSVTSADYLAPSIAQAVHFNFSGSADPRSQLIHHLSSQEIFLLLDNLEHLLEEIDLVVEMLENAPDLKLLVTSRERLGLQGEWVFEVQGLPVPADDQGEGLENYSAVQLFLQRACRAQVEFRLSKEDHPHLVRICRMVEGMPLAIELAATWTPMLSCREIADEIEHSMDILASTLRDVPERHRSLYAVFEHSWRLLTEEERLALRQMSIFRGGFRRDAAEQVVEAKLPLLSTLVAKSLLRRTSTGRYSLHELVRQYATRQLQQTPEDELAARDRHSAYYIDLIARYEIHLKGAQQVAALLEIDVELNNIRTAWQWAASRENFGLLEPALRSFTLAADIRGRLGEGIEQLDLIIQALRGSFRDEGQQAILGQALTQQALLYFRLGQRQAAQARFDESLDILRPLGNPALLIDTLVFSGVVTHLTGAYEQAQSLILEGLASAQAVGNRWFEAYALFNHGYVASLMGHYADGYEYMLAGIALWRTLGDPRSIAVGLNFASPIAIALGHHAQAQAYLEESLALSTEVGDRWGMGTAYRNLGLAALAQGRTDEAQFLIRKGLAIFSDFVSGWDIVRSLVYLGQATAAAGDPVEARQYFLDALRSAMEVQAIPLALDALTGLAHVEAQNGSAQVALELLYSILNHSSTTQEAKDRAGQLQRVLESEMPQEQVEAIRTRTAQKSLAATVEPLLT